MPRPSRSQLLASQLPTIMVMDGRRVSARRHSASFGGLQLSTISVRPFCGRAISTGSAEPSSGSASSWQDRTMQGSSCSWHTQLMACRHSPALRNGKAIGDNLVTQPWHGNNLIHQTQAALKVMKALESWRGAASANSTSQPTSFAIDLLHRGVKREDMRQGQRQEHASPESRSLNSKRAGFGPACVFWSSAGQRRTLHR